MDWRELLRNRWTWAGVAGAAGLGAIVWWRRRGTAPAGGAGAGAAAGTPAYASGAVGSFDSTGTDVAAWLGQYSGSLDNQFKEFRTSVETRLAGIPAEQTGTGTADPAAQLFTAGSDLYQIADSRFGPGGLNTLRTLNPGLDSHIAWLPRPGNQYGNLPVLSSDLTLRLR